MGMVEIVAALRWFEVQVAKWPALWEYLTGNVWLQIAAFLLLVSLFSRWLGRVELHARALAARHSKGLSNVGLDTAEYGGDASGDLLPAASRPRLEPSVHSQSIDGAGLPSGLRRGSLRVAGHRAAVERALCDSGSDEDAAASTTAPQGGVDPFVIGARGGHG